MKDKKTGGTQDALEDLDRNSNNHTVIIDDMGNFDTDPAFNQHTNVNHNIIRKCGDTHHDVDIF